VSTISTRIVSLSKIILPVKQIVYGLGIIIVVLLVFLMTTDAPSDEYLNKTGSIIFDNETILVEIVDTPELRNQGLSGREFLEKSAGMLFVFFESDRYGFWMKDMRFPIDIIWFDDEFVVVDVKENLSPESYPEIFKPKEQARFVLEVNAGVVSQQNIKLNDRANYTSSY